jgi:hypothetical protein
MLQHRLERLEMGGQEQYGTMELLFNWVVVEAGVVKYQELRGQPHMAVVEVGAEPHPEQTEQQTQAGEAEEVAMVR